MDEIIVYQVVNFKCDTCGSLFSIPKSEMSHIYEMECPDCNSPFVKEMNNEF